MPRLSGIGSKTLAGIGLNVITVILPEFYYPLTNTAVDPTNTTWRSTRAPTGYIFVPNNGIYADEPITDMNSMFVDSSSFNDPDTVLWDVSTVTDMTNLFSTDGSGTIFAQDISSWNVLNVLPGNIDIKPGPGFFLTTYYPIWGTDGTIPPLADVWLPDVDYLSSGGWTVVYGPGTGFNPDNTLSIFTPNDNALAAVLRSAQPGDAFYTFSSSTSSLVPQLVTLATTFTEAIFDSGGSFPEADGVWITFYATINESILDSVNNPEMRNIVGKLIYYPASFGGTAEIAEEAVNYSVTTSNYQFGYFDNSGGPENLYLQLQTTDPYLRTLNPGDVVQINFENIPSITITVVLAFFSADALGGQGEWLISFTTVDEIPQSGEPQTSMQIFKTQKFYIKAPFGTADSMFNALSSLGIGTLFEWTSIYSPDPSQQYSAIVLSNDLVPGGDWRFEIVTVLKPTGGSYGEAGWEINRIFIS